MDVQALRAILSSKGQGHILKFWENLTDEEKCALYTDISSLDIEDVERSFKAATNSLANVDAIDEKMTPISSEFCGSSTNTDDKLLQTYWEKGLQEVQKGKVGVLLLAGGQGTRLGFNHPKGQFDVGLLSQKSLFQVQAERIRRLEQLANNSSSSEGKITWYIMTSGATREDTVSFFCDNNYFGLAADQVVFFDQGTLPCLSFDGKILMERPYKVARAPDGNGGLYRALKQREIIRDMEDRGVELIHVYCVDNMLVRPADPAFIGFCLSKGADCAAKVVEKTEPTEAVGVVCCVSGRPQVVEYSEIDEKTAERRDENGKLTFRAGNIANHFFTLDFLRRVSFEEESKLIYHVAKKKIPVVDDTQENYPTVKPSQNNGIKMEKFVFDVFQFAKRFAVWEVRREAEFSPLKNASGPDSADTCRTMLYSEHRRWVEAAGGRLDKPEDCEISPLVSYRGENLTALCKGKTFRIPLLMGAPGEASNVKTL